MSTWILVHRKIFDHWVAEDKPYCRLAAWIYLISRASYEDKTVFFKRPILIKRGEFVTSYRHLSEVFGWGINKTVLFLNQLELEKMINMRSTHNYTVISICNYDNYQCVNGKIKTPIDTPIDTQTERQRNASGTPTEPIKEKKEVKEDKKLKGPYNFNDEDIEIILSQLLLSKILERKPDFKKPNIQSWAKEIDLMIRIDKRNPDRIKTVINWCQEDSFWQNNILSTSKLKKQFDKLEFQMNKFIPIINSNDEIVDTSSVEKIEDMELRLATAICVKIQETHKYFKVTKTAVNKTLDIVTNLIKSGWNKKDIYRSCCWALTDLGNGEPKWSGWQKLFTAPEKIIKKTESGELWIEQWYNKSREQANNNE